MNAQAREGRYRPHINHGGTSYWCEFDYTIAADSEVETVCVDLEDEADGATREWYPHIREGILRGWNEAQTQGTAISQVRVVVRKIYTHPVDTTAKGCERYGFNFALDHLRLE